jgi:Ser/Thr protein kinase RdoA (MazF antagonist)
MSAAANPELDLRGALEAYAFSGDPRVTPLRQGLIHQTFIVDDDEGSYILQRVHRDFGASVVQNIERVTQRLRSRGVSTFTLIRSRGGELLVPTVCGANWRLMTRLEGEAHQACDSPELAAAAGALVAEFHSALEDFREPLLPLGFPFHDWAAHKRDLTEALSEFASHRLYKPVKELAEELLAAPTEWADLGPLPVRVVHGDLKLNNLLFVRDEGGVRGNALIDLDTVGRRPLFVELGDAWRSWCNRSADETDAPAIDLEVFRASIEAYLDAVSFALDRAELHSLAFGLERISHELAIRFAADALREAHWTHDTERFPGAGEHNLARARAQWALCRHARAARPEMLKLLAG